MGLSSFAVVAHFQTNHLTLNAHVLHFDTHISLFLCHSSMCSVDALQLPHSLGFLYCNSTKSTKFYTAKLLFSLASFNSAVQSAVEASFFLSIIYLSIVLIFFSFVGCSLVVCSACKIHNMMGVGVAIP